jgi:ATP-dependent Clp protease protease subunit
MARIVKESIDRFFEHNLHFETRTIYIGGGDEDEIDSKVASNVIKATHLLVAADPEKPVTVLINSFGGCWFNGWAIYDCIKACPAEVTAFVIGSAMSMGSVILQAADHRIIYPHATVMVHDGYESRMGDIPQTFQNWAEYSKKSRARMYKLYAERSSRPVGYWRKKCSSDLILSAPEALELGLVDAIHGVTV